MLGKVTTRVGHVVADLLIFSIDMIYFRWYLVVPHVKTVQNMYGKRGKRVSGAELRPAKVDPHFEREKNALGGVAFSFSATIFRIQHNHCN